MENKPTSSISNNFSTTKNDNVGTASHASLRGVSVLNNVFLYFFAIQYTKETVLYALLTSV